MGEYILYDLSVSGVNVLKYCIFSVLLAQAFGVVINVIDKLTIEYAAKTGSKVTYYEMYDIGLTKGKDVITIDGKHKFLLWTIWLIPLGIIGLEIWFEFSFNSTVVEDVKNAPVCWNETGFDSSLYYPNYGNIPVLTDWMMKNRPKESHIDISVNGTLAAAVYSAFRITAECYNLKKQDWFNMRLRYNTTLRAEPGNGSYFNETQPLIIYDVFCNNTLVETQNGTLIPGLDKFDGAIEIVDVRAVRLIVAYTNDYYASLWSGLDAMITVSYNSSQGTRQETDCILRNYDNLDPWGVDFISCDFNGEYHRSNTLNPNNEPQYDILIPVDIGECLSPCATLRQNGTRSDCDMEESSCEEYCTSCRTVCMQDPLSAPYCPMLFDSAYVMRGFDKLDETGQYYSEICDGLAFDSELYRCLSMWRELIQILTSEDLRNPERPNLLASIRMIYTGIIYGFMSNITFYNNSETLYHNHVFNSQYYGSSGTYLLDDYVYASLESFTGNWSCGQEPIIAYRSVPTVEQVTAIVILILLPIGTILILYDMFFEYARMPVNRFRDLMIVDGVIRFRHEYSKEQEEAEKKRRELAEQMADPQYEVDEKLIREPEFAHRATGSSYFSKLNLDLPSHAETAGLHSGSADTSSSNP